MNNYENIIENCKNITYQKSNNIEYLKPNNIDIVIALGDSITAGFGIQGISGLDNEYRGRSWSIGGENNQITLPNFIKYYNPNLKGYSIGNHSAEVCISKNCNTKYHKNDNYNLAQSGAKTNNLIYQIHHLEKIISADFKKKWKLITILIGANDLCGICNNNNINLKEYEYDLRKALVLLKKKFPKSIVNMMLIFNISQVYEVSRKSLYCKDFHSIIFEECICAFSPINGEKNREIIDLYAEKYRDITKNIVNNINSNNNKTFRIMLQPTLSIPNLSKFPINYLSTLDCFHPSLLAHQSMAIALWNNLFLKNKQGMKEHPDIFCPNNNSLIYTKNE